MKKLSIKNLSLDKSSSLSNEEKRLVLGGAIVGPLPPININPCSIMRCPTGYVCVTYECSTGNTMAKCVRR